MLASRFPFLSVWYDGCRDQAAVDTAGWASFDAVKESIFKTGAITVDSGGRFLVGLEKVLGGLQRQGVATGAFFSGQAVSQLSLMSHGDAATNADFFIMAGESPPLIASQLCTMIPNSTTPLSWNSTLAAAVLEQVYTAYPDVVDLPGGATIADQAEADAQAMCDMELMLLITSKDLLGTDPECKQPDVLALLNASVDCTVNDATCGGGDNGYDLNGYFEGILPFCSPLLSIFLFVRHLSHCSRLF
jgi:hypothetical protein